MHAAQKFIAAAALALSLGTVFSTAATAQDAPSQTSAADARRARDEKFAQRLQMIEALQSGDDARLNEMVRADTHLELYYFLLRRATWENDVRLTQKLLNLPALDKTSADYRKVAGGAYAEIAGNGFATSPEMTALLFDPIRNDKAVKDDCLRFIFETAAMFYGDRSPNAEMTRLLIRNGADLDAAVANVTKEVRSNSNPLLQGSPEERLARVEKLRAAVTAPEAKPDLHLQF